MGTDTSFQSCRIRLARAATFVVATLASSCATGTPPAIDSLAVTEDLLAYRHSQTEYKPYVERLFTPAGVQVLRDAPEDHVHHHGLMLALGLNEDVDFWGEVNAKVAGRQVGGPLTTAAVDGSRTLAQEIEWTEPRDSTVLLRERRTVAVSEPEADRATLVTWTSQLVPASGRVRVWGRHYFGLGMRFVESMDGTGTFVTKAGDVREVGKVVRGDERLVRAAWCAYAVECDGRRVTVAMFDHPENPRHPATFFTMRRPFAYLSATLGLHTEPLHIETGTPMQLCYGVALWDGFVTPVTIEKLYRQWASSTDPDN